MSEKTREQARKDHLKPLDEFVVKAPVMNGQGNREMVPVDQIGIILEVHYDYDDKEYRDLFDDPKEKHHKFWVEGSRDFVRYVVLFKHPEGPIDGAAFGYTDGRRYAFKISVYDAEIKKL